MRRIVTEFRPICLKNWRFLTSTVTPSVARFFGGASAADAAAEAEAEAGEGAEGLGLLLTQHERRPA